MWTLVNASYGIAMGQRPTSPAETGGGRTVHFDDSPMRVFHPACVHARWRPSLLTVKNATRHMRSLMSSMSAIASYFSSK